MFTECREKTIEHLLWLRSLDADYARFALKWTNEIAAKVNLWDEKEFIQEIKDRHALRSKN